MVWEWESDSHSGGEVRCFLRVRLDGLILGVGVREIDFRRCTNSNSRMSKMAETATIVQICFFPIIHR